MTAVVGANADELDRAAWELRRAAAELDAQVVALSGQVRSVAWVGGVATQFGSRWRRTHGPRLQSTVGAVRAAADRLERNAEEQRTASRAAPVALPNSSRPRSGSSSSWTVAGAPSQALVGLGSLLHGLDAGRAVVEAALDAAAQVAGDAIEDLAGFVEVLADDNVQRAISGLDVVRDAGAAIVDLVADFVSHPGLSFDERVVHALADTAARFGVEQGMEVAADWLATAATATLIPAVGALLAPFVGEIAGAVAGEIIDAAIDVVDGATDIVDSLADAAVEAYREVLRSLGVLIDAGEFVVAAVGEVADLAGDTVGAVDGLLDAVFGDP